MRGLLVLLLIAIPIAAETKVTLLHFSDYHSHALPFYTEEGERAGSRGPSAIFAGRSATARWY